jgi:hypothetical protein
MYNGSPATPRDITASNLYQLIGYGMFASLEGDSIVQNILLKGSININVNPSSDSYVGVGALTGGGSNGFLVRNIASGVELKVALAGNYVGYTYIGGIAGVQDVSYRGSRVENCYSSGDITVSNNTGTEAWSDEISISGIAEYAQISNCLASGSISEDGSSDGNSELSIGGISAYEDSSSGITNYVENSVALMDSLTASVNSFNEEVIHRISNNTNTGATVNSWANVNMTLTGFAGSRTPEPNSESSDGGNLSFAQAKTQSWWTGTADWDFAANEGAATTVNPWLWTGSDKPPRLWFVSASDDSLPVLGEDTAETYTVTFKSNDGSLTLAEIPVTAGDNIQLPYYAAPGKVTLEWDEDLSTPESSWWLNTDYGPVTEDIIFYAIEDDSISVSFDLNGGTGDAPSPATGSVTDGVWVEFDGADSFSRPGYIFLGWSEDPDAVTADYEENNSASFAESTTFYAVWAEAVTIAYNFNGATAQDNYSGKVYGGYSVSLVKDETTYLFDYDGSYFTLSSPSYISLSDVKMPQGKLPGDGWALTKANADSGVADYDFGEEITASSDLTLYLVLADAVTITYNLNGGTASIDWGPQVAELPTTVPKGTATDLLDYDESSNRLQNDDIYFPDVTLKEGSVLGGWATSQANAEAGTIAHALGGSFTPTASVTLWAVWLDTWSIKYYYNNDTENYTEVLVPKTHSSTFNTSSSGKPSGSALIGWAIDEETADTPKITSDYYAGAEFTPSSDMELWAVWAAARIATTNYATFQAAWDAVGGAQPAGSTIELLAYQRV